MIMEAEYDMRCQKLDTFVFVSQRTSSCLSLRVSWPVTRFPMIHGIKWHPGLRTSSNFPNLSLMPTVDWFTCTKQKNLPIAASSFPILMSVFYLETGRKRIDLVKNIIVEHSIANQYFLSSLIVRESFGMWKKTEYTEVTWGLKATKPLEIWIFWTFEICIVTHKFSPFFSNA